MAATSRRRTRWSSIWKTAGEWGSTVLPPDVNSSDVEFGVLIAQPSPSGRGQGEGAAVGWAEAAEAHAETPHSPLTPHSATRPITFGLSAIKGCGGQAAVAIVAERNKNGPYRDLFDFCERVDPAACNRATIESLIKAGAFDGTGGRRAQLMAVLDRALQTGAATLADRRSGQKGLFDAPDDDPAPADKRLSLPDIPEWDEKERLAFEKEVLGYYLASHPLAEHAEMLASYCSHTTAAVPGLRPAPRC